MADDWAVSYVMLLFRTIMDVQAVSFLVVLLRPKTGQGLFSLSVSLPKSSQAVVGCYLPVQRLSFLSVSSGRLSLGLVLLGNLGSVISVELVVNSLASRRRLVGSGIGVGLGVLNIQRYLRVCKGAASSSVSCKRATDSADSLEARSI